MVISDMLITMSGRTASWSVADAKARLSELLDEACKRPQTITRRGRPLVVVVPVEEFEDQGDAARWRRFLDVSAEVRAAGGGEICVPRRTPRRSPFARS
jgi:prevent-host-death family protein